MKERLIDNRGINDSTYPVNWTENGKNFRCPIYSAWKDLIIRTNPEAIKRGSLKHYEECFCCDNWLRFSNFYSWSLDKFKAGYQLDKDILFIDNKLYSEDTCCFVPKKVNNMFRPNNRESELARGVRSKILKSGVIKYEAFGKHYVTGANVYLGFHNSVEEAHKHWQSFKIEMLYLCIDDLKK